MRQCGTIQGSKGLRERGGFSPNTLRSAASRHGDAVALGKKWWVEFPIRILQQKYGEKRAYLGGPGVSIGGDDAIDIALERAGAKAKPALVAVEAAGLVAMKMLEKDGILTIGAVAMPGSAPVVRLMMYPDGPRLGVDPIAASLDRAFDRLAKVILDPAAARTQLLG
jgi:hypothetical protein